MIRRTNTLGVGEFKSFKPFKSFKSFWESLTRLSLYDCIIAEFGPQTRQRAIGGIEIPLRPFDGVYPEHSRRAQDRPFVKKAQLFGGSPTGFGLEFDFDNAGREFLGFQAQADQIEYLV
jgi:hypothetical protein